MQLTIGKTPASPAPAAARRPLSMVLTTRRVLPWERPSVQLPAVAAPAPRDPDHARRAELSRQLSLMPAQLVRQLLTAALQEAPASIRRDLLIRQLRETAPAERRDLLALHLRTLGPSLVRAGALVDAEGHLCPEVLEDGSLDILLEQLGAGPEVGTATDPRAAVPGVSPLVAGLCEGDSGRAVVALQARLLALGYLTEETFGASPGVFDVGTAAALRAFQSDRLLPVTGYYGTLTHLSLCAETATS